MHISQLHISGIKALDRTIELAPLTLVAGPNASGKTAILESIRFALLGYCPGMSKTNQALFDLSNGNRMQVRLQMSDGTLCTRGLSIGPKGAITADPTTDTADLVTPCLDPELYFGMTEKDRVQYIFEHCAVGGDFTGAGIAAKVANAITAPEPVTPEFLREKAVVIERVQLKATFGTDGGVQEALEEVSSDLRELFKESNAAAKDSQGAVSTLTELRLTSEQVFATVPELEKQKAEAQTKIEELQKKAGGLAAQNEEAERVERQRRQIEEALRAPGVDDKTIQDAEAIADNLIEKAREADDARQAAKLEMENKGTHDVIPVRAAYGRASTNLSLASSARQVADLEVRDITAELDALEAQECCPHCKSKGKSWKNNLKDTLNARLTAAKEMALKCEQTEDLAKAEEAKADKALDEAEKELAAYTRLFAEHRHRAGLHAEANTAATYQVAQVKNLRDQIESQRQARAQLNNQLRDLATVQRPSAEEMSRLTGDIALLRAKIADLNVRLDTANRTKFDLQRAEQAAQLHKQHAAKRDVLKAAGTAVVKLKADLVTEAFTTLLERANSVTGDLLKTPLSYHPERNDLGRWDGHVFVTHRTFSGVEKKLAYIGLSVALAWESPFRIVLLDELTTATGEKATIVLQRLLELVENDVIHQAVVVEPSDAPIETPGWHLVSTAAEQPAIA